MTHSEDFLRTYRYRAYAVFGTALVLLLFRFFGHGLLHSIQNPLFVFEEKELVYRLFVASNLPQLLTGNMVIGWVFDACLLLLPIAFVVTLNRWLAVAFATLLLVYFFTFNVVTGHHYHGLVGALIIAIPFFTKNETRFNLLWQGVRYYLLYIFVSAALWKIFRGSVFYTEQMSNILRAQQLSLLLQNAGTVKSQLVQYIIANPPAGHVVLAINVLVQFAFVVGFFTRRFDRVLLALLLVFCLANYFVMSIVSAELLILGLCLVDWNTVGKPNQLAP